MLYGGDARLGPPLAEPLQAHVSCNLLSDQPLTLAQAGKDAARAFWVAPSPNRLRAYGNALPRPPALQLPGIAKTHAHEMPVQYPQRPEFEAAKKILRAGVLLRLEQEISRGSPVNPVDDAKLATRAVDHIRAVAPLATQPTLTAITHQGLAGAQAVRQRYWDISNEDQYCGGHYPGRGFKDPGEEAQPVRGYAKLSDTAEVLTRLVLPGKLPPDAVKVNTRRYATGWMQPADPPIRDKPQRKNTAVMAHEIDMDRYGVADILRIDTPAPRGHEF